MSNDGLIIEIIDQYQAQALALPSPGNIQSRNLDIIFLHKIDHFDSIWKSKRSRIRDILDFDTCAD